MAHAESPETDHPSNEPRCPICLESFTDRSFTDPCFHSFCFSCILQWSEVSTSCPLCKTHFIKIIHDIKANDHYDVYEVTAKNKEVAEVSLHEARRFWYRSSVVPGQPAYKRRAQKNRVAAAEQRRRVVYSVGLWVKPLPPEGGKIRIRNISVQFFKKNPASSHRLIPWLIREFNVLVGKKHSDFMVQLVLSLVDKVELQSREFVTHLSPFLHDKTDHFLHEFISFAKSPYDMIAYDDKCSYDFTHQPRQQQGTVVEEDRPGPSSGASNMDSLDGIWPVLEPCDDEEPAQEGSSTWDVPPAIISKTTAHVDKPNSPINLITPDNSRTCPQEDGKTSTPPTGHCSEMDKESNNAQSDLPCTSLEHRGVHKDISSSSSQHTSRRQSSEKSYSRSKHKHQGSRSDYRHGDIGRRRSKGKGKYRPTRRDYSPTRRDYSPTRRDYSPTRRDYSPTRCDYSPARHGYSPTRHNYSPTRRDYFPTRRDYSPTRHDDSPTRCNDSPTRHNYPSTRHNLSRRTQFSDKHNFRGKSLVLEESCGHDRSVHPDQRWSHQISSSSCSAESHKDKVQGSCEPLHCHSKEERALENELETLSEQINKDKKELLKKLLQKEKVEYLKNSLNYEEECFKQADM